MGGSSKAAAPVVQTNTTSLSPEQQQLFGLAMPFAKQAASQPLANYEGPTVAGFNTDQTQAQEGYKAQIPGIENLAGKAATSQDFLLSPDQLNPNSNPYLQSIASNITNLMGRQLTEQILPNVRAGEIAASGPYAGGSTREQLAERLAGDVTQRNTGTALTQLYGDAYGRGLSNMRSAVDANPGVLSQQLFGSDVLGSVGGQEQAQQQTELDAARNKWTLEQSLPYLRASEILGLLGGIPGGTGTSTVSGATPPGVSPMKGIIGGGMSGAAIGTAILPGVGTAAGAGLGALLGYLGR